MENYYVTDGSAAIKLCLRRTLVRLVVLSWIHKFKLLIKKNIRYELYSG